VIVLLEDAVEDLVAVVLHAPPATQERDPLLGRDKYECEYV